MKLIKELTEEVQVLKEQSEDGGGLQHYIEGIIMQSELTNRNGRKYPKNVLVNEMHRYNRDYVSKKRAFGELGHPKGPTINLDRVSHMFTNLREDGNNVVGKAKVMDTPMGRIVKNLIDEDACIGISSRGMGTLKENNGIMEVQNDFKLATAGDIVADPSAPDAFVKGVMEGVEWIYSEVDGWIMSDQNQFEKIYEDVHNTARKSTKELEEKAARLFESYLNILTK